MSIRLMNCVWTLTDLNPFQKLVLVALADRANDDGVCWPSIDTLAKRTGMTGRGVQKVIRSIEDLGLLERQESTGRSNKYLLKLPLNGVHPQEDDPRTQFTPPLNSVHPTPEPRSPNTSIIHQGNISNKGKRAKPAQEPPPKTGPFQDAINAQSQQGRARLNRPKAWIAWQRLSKVHGEEKLLAAYKRYLSTDKDAQRDNGDWQAGLQVWLNQKAEIWIDAQTKATAPPSLQMIRRWVEGAINAPTLGFDEWKAGMSFQEARELVAAAEADGRLTPRPKITEEVF